MNQYEGLESLFKQMESELRYLKPAEKQSVKKFMIFAFERGESSTIKKYL
ncbi:hypothetical protein JOC34_000590 [Virgibacillus halotolerans]|nr:hypothetical protein [Virgibacillus halotolerans]MBM7598233.1 hypothetical protein [Virgibacillus halotolerans]